MSVLCVVYPTCEMVCLKEFFFFPTSDYRYWFCVYILCISAWPLTILIEWLGENEALSKLYDFFVRLAGLSRFCSCEKLPRESALVRKEVSVFSLLIHNSGQINRRHMLCIPASCSRIFIARNKLGAHLSVHTVIMALIHLRFTARKCLVFLSGCFSFSLPSDFADLTAEEHTFDTLSILF